MILLYVCNTDTFRRQENFAVADKDKVNSADEKNLADNAR